MQTQIEFTHPHNNAESAMMFEQNKSHFSNQCKIVYEALKRGEKLTSLGVAYTYQITALPRRIKDLRDIYGINVQTEKNGRFATYYL